MSWVTVTPVTKLLSHGHSKSGGSLRVVLFSEENNVGSVSASTTLAIVVVGISV